MGRPVQRSAAEPGALEAIEQAAEREDPRLGSGPRRRPERSWGWALLPALLFIGGIGCLAAAALGGPAKLLVAAAVVLELLGACEAAIGATHLTAARRLGRR